MVHLSSWQRRSLVTPSVLQSPRSTRSLHKNTSTSHDNPSHQTSNHAAGDAFFSLVSFFPSKQQQRERERSRSQQQESPLSAFFLPPCISIPLNTSCSHFSPENNTNPHLLKTIPKKVPISFQFRNCSNK